MKHIHHQWRGLLLCSLCIAKSLLPPPPHTQHTNQRNNINAWGWGGLFHIQHLEFSSRNYAASVYSVCVLCKMSDKHAWMARRTHSGNVLVREEDFTFPHLDIYSVDFTHLTNQMRCFKTILYLLYIYIYMFCT